MTKKEIQLAKEKILKCLTQDFEYGTRKDGKPLKHQKRNQAIFNEHEGWAVYNGTDLYMVMEAVVLGLYLALDDAQTTTKEN